MNFLSSISICSICYPSSQIFIFMYYPLCLFLLPLFFFSSNLFLFHCSTYVLFVFFFSLFLSLLNTFHSVSFTLFYWFLFFFLSFLLWLFSSLFLLLLLYFFLNVPSFSMFLSTCIYPYLIHAWFPSLTISNSTPFVIIIYGSFTANWSFLGSDWSILVIDYWILLLLFIHCWEWWNVKDISLTREVALCHCLTILLQQFIGKMPSLKKKSNFCKKNISKKNVTSCK